MALQDSSSPSRSLGEIFSKEERVDLDMMEDGVCVRKDGICVREDGVCVREDGICVREAGVCMGDSVTPLLNVISLNNVDIYFTCPLEVNGSANELLDAVARVGYLRTA